jgi:uncharacterized protein
MPRTKLFLNRVFPRHLYRGESGKQKQEGEIGGLRYSFRMEPTSNPVIDGSGLEEKQKRLDDRARELGSVLVAYSGGIDSAYLAWSFHRALGEKMLAIIADSPSLARRHLDEALAFAHEHGIPVQVIRTDELENPDYVKNDAQRCFHCKSELFTVMEKTRARLGFRHLAYGMNTDDRGEFRPGQDAARLHAVLAPLAEAGLSKAEIRELARAARLRVWDKPASACLSSRIAYGQPVTRPILQRIEAGEEVLRELGFRQFRVRDHGELARIEIARDELPRALSPEMAAHFSGAFKKLGFHYVTLDCEGFRSGSMNAALAPETLEPAHAARLS